MLDPGFQPKSKCELEVFIWRVSDDSLLSNESGWFNPVRADLFFVFFSPGRRCHSAAHQIFGKAIFLKKDRHSPQTCERTNKAISIF